ncbi:MAG: Ig-like domain-containing protein [Bacteroidota bacterium]
MRLFTTLLFVMLSAGITMAQSFTERAFFTTGGSFSAPGNYVKCYEYDPVSNAATVIDSSFGDFSNAVTQENQFVYYHVGRAGANPAGADLIVKLDARNTDRVDSATNVSGTQNIALYNDWLLINRGFGATGNYFLAFDKNDLAAGPAFQDADIPTSTSGMTILNDTAYVSFTQNDTGRLARFDLTGMLPTFVDIVAMDTFTSGIGDLFTDGQRVYGLAQKFDANFALVRARVVTFDPATSSWTADSTGRASGGVALYDNFLYADFGNGLGRYDVSTQQEDLSFSLSVGYNSAVFDTLNELLYVQQSDFFSFGRLAVLDTITLMGDSISTDISGSAITLTYNSVPTAGADTFTLPNNQPFSLPESLLLANDTDSDGDSLTFSLVQNGVSGSWANGVYQPQSGFNGTDGLLYAATDVWGRSDTVEVVLNVTFPASLADAQTQSDLTAYPNPFQDRLMVSWDKPLESIGKLEVFSANGQAVYSAVVNPGINEVPVQLAGLPTGTYWVRLSSDQLRWQTTILKR